MDRLTIHQIEALLKEIEKTPPTNVIVMQLLRELRGEQPEAQPSEADQEAAFAQLPNVETKRANGQVDGPIVLSRTGNRIRKMVLKRSGKQVI